MGHTAGRRTASLPKWFKSILKANRLFWNLQNLPRLSRTAILTGSPERSYHSIMESAVYQKFEFDNISDAKEIMNQFRDFYNRFGAPI